MRREASDAEPLVLYPSAGSKGARRRAEFVRIAGRIVATEGVGALSAARVAELAGCARTLVYRYFPTVEDLRFAVLQTALADLDRRLPPDIAAAGIRELSRATDGTFAPETQTMVGMSAGFWADPPAGIDRRAARYVTQAAFALIRASAVTDTFGPHQPQVRRQLERRWVAPLREQGLSSLDIDIVTDCAATVIHRAIEAGLGRDEFNQLVLTVLSSLIRALSRATSRKVRRRSRRD